MLWTIILSAIYFLKVYVAFKIESESSQIICQNIKEFGQVIVRDHL
jgi:hypothetical protein